MRYLFVILLASSCFGQALFRGQNVAAAAAGFTFGTGGAGESIGGGSPVVDSAPFNAPTGSTVACIVTWNGGDPAMTGATDSAGNTYTLGIAGLNAVNRTQAAYFINIPSGSASLVVTANTNYPSNISAITCVPITGGVTALETGSNLPANGSNGNSGTSAALTTTTAATAIVVGCGLDRAGTTAITTSGYAMKVQSASQASNLAGKIAVATVVAETTGWTFTNGPWWSCATLAFK